MTDARRPALAPLPLIEWLPASDDRNRVHLVSSRRHSTACALVQQECRLNSRLVSNFVRSTSHSVLFQKITFCGLFAGSYWLRNDADETSIRWSSDVHAC